MDIENTQNRVEEKPRKPPHRITQINYIPRTLGFASIFIALILLSHEREISVLHFGISALLLLVYPHLVYLHGWVVQDSKKAEMRYLLLDCLLLGAWAGALGLHLWITFTLLAATLLNNAVNGGLPRLGIGFGIFTGSGIIGFLTLSPGFMPSASLRVDLFVMATSLLYILGLGVTFYRQNRRLAHAHGEIAHKNRIFQSLIKLGMLTNESIDLQSLVRHALSQLQALHPEKAFGVVRFSSDRPELVEQAVFLGLSEPQERRILKELQKKHGRPNPRSILELSDQDLLVKALPLDRHLSHGNAYLLLSSPAQDIQHEELQLFVDQLGSALENKLLTEELRRAAETDGLTQLYNRAFLEDKLQEVIEAKKNFPDLDFAIILIDLIGLKRANDEQGHAVGDALIKHVATSLMRIARETDLVARYGGDEFVILCQNCSEIGAQQAVDRIRTRVENKSCPIQTEMGRTLEVPIQLSIGIAGSDQHSPEKVLTIADHRMYENKEAYYALHQRYR